MKNIFPYIFTLVYWISLFFSVNSQSIARYSLLIFLAWYFIVAVFIGGRFFYRQWNIWLNVFLLFISSFVFVSIITSQAVRNVYIVFIGLIGGIVIYALIKYFEDQKSYTAKNYLRFWVSPSLLHSGK